MSSVSVIGGGIAGIATAALLARHGHQVTVCERGSELGGRMGTLSIDGFRFDTGPSWYLMPEAFEHYFAHFGTTPQQEFGLTRLDPAYQIFSGNSPAAPALSVRTGHAEELFESIDPGSGARLHAYLDSAALTYNLALRHFLYTTFTRPRDFLVPEIAGHLPRLASLLTRPLSTKAAAVTRHPVLRKILEYPAVFLSSRPEAIPSLYHLMSHTDLTQGVFYPTGGFYAVVESIARLATQHGVRVLTDCEVTGIDVAGSRARGLHTSAGYVPADYVVSAADLHHTETALLPRAARSYPERWWARRDPGPSTVLVMLGVRGSLNQLSHHNLLLSEDWRPDFDAVYSGAWPRYSQSIYVCRPSATDPTVAPAGYENLFVLVPVPADPGYGATEQVAQAVVDQLGRRIGVPDLARRVVVRSVRGPGDFHERYHAWQAGAIGPAHTLRQSAFLRGSNASRRVRNLFYSGGTTLPGVGVPMCLISAENILERIPSATPVIG
ncbi:phytoene desaturase family protein [Corynebacterium uberis]|uniref:phytoene desaturase family protein n=1 Tax=Corynebacterium TaxID=1716 RepID=UPI001D0AF5CB|nr:MULTISPECIES: phytoene desaturase family protein [Corynebacterium]MCZ9310018.1 phytoene desaturase family protein [Corynebacterium sp. c6VSa_13]UDL73767.1 phytoene desaturase [Corynebacterium uberis]UDL75349.1 phytoene desaturase [Corynebacterium uberis]UDL77560.1 phytoene desaturase [Corynebacterium uberis]UDL79847.1 phytoene desaturase [Corynebacterium uberis]